MKKQTKLKAFMLSVAMAVAMSLPMTMNAQSDGFFRGNGGGYSNRDAGIGLGNMNNETPGGMGLGGMTQEEPAPLGSGLLILTAIGAGYAALKRKQHNNH